MTTLLLCTATPISAIESHPLPEEIIEQIKIGGASIEIPPGRWTIDSALMIESDDTVLHGYATIEQMNPEQAIIRVQEASRVRILNLTLTRSEGKSITREEAIRADDTDLLTLRDVTIINNQTDSAAIRVQTSRRATIADCSIVNYKRIAIDDRTDSVHYGYAFQCINGHGIVVERSTEVRIERNRIVEDVYHPTRIMKVRHGLGQLVDGKLPNRQGTLSAEVFRNNSVNNWHQGSAILVTSPDVSSTIQILDNQITHCAQGIDIHADNVLCRGNQIDYGMIGIKALHGSEHLIITENMLTRIDLWGIVIGAGTASSRATPATDTESARPSNTDGGTIITSNVIAEYGFGDEFWNWGGKSKDRDGAFAIRLDRGQLDTNPPLTDVLIEGNIVRNSGEHGMIEDGKIAGPEPRYKYALLIEEPKAGPREGSNAPQDIRIGVNAFDSGIGGVTNVDLNEFK